MGSVCTTSNHTILQSIILKSKKPKCYHRSITITKLCFNSLEVLLRVQKKICCNNNNTILFPIADAKTNINYTCIRVEKHNCERWCHRRLVIAVEC